ncbi:TetR/AcrR family transcriptional regulator [Alkalibacter rhizosphaerae]|uniref:TetR/AcrR family transcriptional regulator n=1 Tax=Alkalibacter rhizosphaerae TaxID=2815577 RepID=A0A974XFH2_9FIRM|nr:TetR/AcrR family transcriptional regulator [Alkalibacter rhizosphaerae]QSX07655.1 TetR/AcrR family transcriptional regulator [Alkalibacter rhizosphaerae]
MGYKKSRNTKEKIINACRRLFYENGYINTRYEDLSEATGLSPGVIHYHFQSKKNMAGIIYDEFLTSNKALVNQLLEEEYELQIRTAVEIRSYMNLLLSDDKFKRFYLEICQDRVIVDLFRETGVYFYQLHRDEYNLDISDGMIAMINITSAAAETELIMNYFKGDRAYSFEDIVEFNIRLNYELMAIDYEKINEIVEMSRYIYDTLQVRFKDHFELDIQVVGQGGE